MFRKMAESKPVCEEILRTVLSDSGLEIIENIKQCEITNLQGRSAVLDVKCVLGNGRQVNIEVQKADDDDHQRRVRYNASLLTTNITEPGAKFRDVPDVIVVYITRKDFLDGNSPIYFVDRVLRGSNRVVHNGLQEIYVNAAVYDGSDISELMRIYKENDTYSEKFPATSERKKLFKYHEKEAEIMSEELLKMMEEEHQEGVREGIREGKREGIREGSNKSNLNAIRAMMSKWKVTAEQALETLNIPKTEWDYYLALI